MLLSNFLCIFEENRCLMGSVHQMKQNGYNGLISILKKSKTPLQATGFLTIFCRPFYNEPGSSGKAF